MRKVIFTLLIICTTVLTSNAQDTYMKLYGGENATTFTSFNKTKDGNIFLLTRGTIAANSFDKQNMVLLNAAGDTLWATVLSDSSSTDSYSFDWSVIQTPDTGYLVVSEYRGIVTDILLIKLNKKGKLLWTKKISNSLKYWTSVSKVTMGADGNALLCGSADAFGDKHAFLMKINPLTGSLIWMKTIGTNTGTEGKQLESFSAVFPTKDTGSVVCGSDSRLNGSDILYARYNKAGTCLWIKRIQVSGGWSDKNLAAIVEAADGGFVFCGISYSGSFDSDNILFKAKSNGDPVWLKQMGTPYGSYGSATALVRNKDNTYTLVGKYKSGTFNRYTGFIAKIDDLGSGIWYNEIGYNNIKTKPNTKRDIRFGSVERLKDGAYLAGASVSDGNLSANDSTLLIKFDKNGNTCNTPATAGGSYTLEYTIPTFTFDTADALSSVSVKDTALFTQQKVILSNRVICTSVVVAKDNAFNNIESDSKIVAEFSLSIYPNPVINNNLSLSLVNAGIGNVYITIAELKGKTVYKEKIVNSAFRFSKTINISTLVPGMYMLKASNGQKEKTVKFVKQ